MHYGSDTKLSKVINDKSSLEQELEELTYITERKNISD